MLPLTAEFWFPQGSYQGCTLLSPVSKWLHVPLDHVNFFFGQVFALFVAIGYRRYLPPPGPDDDPDCRRKRIRCRHVFATVSGMLLAFFCYGLNAWHVLWQTLVTYVLLGVVPDKPWITLAVCLAHLSIVHLSRLRNDYLKYTVDATGTLMISTQKLSALAFALYDGRRRKKTDCHLSVDQQEHMVDERPGLLELLSFVLNFHGILVGPLCFYKDYVRFVTGNDELLDFLPSKDGNVFWPVTIKLTQSLLFLALYLGLGPLFPVETVLDHEFVTQINVFLRLIYLFPCMFLIRCKYYFAWKLSEAVNNAAGLGFNGFDERTGAQKWNLLKNVSCLKTEFGTSLKVKQDNWNINTSVWLRRVCYDRVRTGRTFLVYCLSAFWHGFYPGYYFTFVSVALLNYAGRGFRRVVRPHIVAEGTPIWLKPLYDLVTWAAATSGANYCAVSFMLLDFSRSLQYYKQMYFFLQIICLLACIFLPVGSTKAPRKHS